MNVPVMQGQISTNRDIQKYKPTYLGAGNNINLMLTNKGTSVVMQFAGYTDRQLNAKRELAGESFVARHFEPDVTIPKNEGLDITPSVMIVESCKGSIKDQARAVAADKKISNIQNIVPQLTDMLDKLKSKGVIWTDLKIGNVLVRNDDTIAISDFKGFCKQSELRLSTGIAVFTDVTDGCLSEHFKQHNLSNTKPGNAGQVWEKEHSYQLAAIIYTMATGEDIGNINKASFTNPIFNTPEGQRLKVLIKSLGKEDPAQRMSYGEAAIALKCISNEIEFKSIMDRNHIDMDAALSRPRFAVDAKPAATASPARRDDCTPPARLVRATSIKKMSSSIAPKSPGVTEIKPDEPKVPSSSRGPRGS